MWLLFELKIPSNVKSKLLNIAFVRLDIRHANRVLKEFCVSCNPRNLT